MVAGHDAEQTVGDEAEQRDDVDVRRRREDHARLTDTAKVADGQQRDEADRTRARGGRAPPGTKLEIAATPAAVETATVRT